MIILAWLFGSAWMHLSVGAAFTRFATLLGVTPLGFGILAAIPFLGAVVQLPASFFIERYGYRKAVFLWACTAHRFLWLLIAAIPWMFPPRLQWPALLTLMFVSTLLANVSAPAWMSWMADVIPSRIRGRYNARRIQYGQAVGVVLSLLAGLALDWPDPEQRLLLRNIISAMFLVAGLCGMVDILFFARVPDDKPVHVHPHLGLRELVSRPLRNPAFRAFLGYSATMTFATGYIGQFIWLYLFEEVGMTNLTANLLLVTVPTLVSMAAYPFWGRIVDRYGSKPALLLAGLVVVNGASAWILVRQGSWVPGYILVLTAVVAWPGMDLGAFNLLLRLTESGDKGRSGSAVVAINSLVVAIAGTLSGVFGGVVAQWLGRSWRITVLGWPISYHGVLFLVSAVLRLGALGWILRLEEGRRLATRDALRYIVTSVYSNRFQATFFPLRMWSSLSRLTWRLPGGKGRARAATQRPDRT
ncbi:MAG: MFS transporter [Lentisphaeria bacterium]|nr:MFS transporter [Lentisphaeria bacterium]